MLVVTYCIQDTIHTIQFHNIEGYPFSAYCKHSAITITITITMIGHVIW